MGTPARLRDRLFLSVLVALVAATPRVAMATSVLFYDPDASHQTIVSMTKAFNDYFKAVGTPLRFRPIQNREDFERISLKPDSVLAIISSSYLRSNVDSGWVPKLVPTYNGDPFYRKILLSRKPLQNLSLRSSTVATTLATTDARAGTKELLAGLRRRGLDTEGASVLRVSVDIDALMALVSGMADAAVVTQRSVDILTKINQHVASTFHRVKEISKNLRSPLCVRSRAGSAVAKKFLDLMKRMADHPAGAAAMKALSVTSWVPFQPRALRGEKP